MGPLMAPGLLEDTLLQNTWLQLLSCHRRYLHPDAPQEQV